MVTPTVITVTIRAQHFGTQSCSPSDDYFSTAPGERADLFTPEIDLDTHIEAVVEFEDLTNVVLVSLFLFLLLALRFLLVPFS